MSRCIRYGTSLSAFYPQESYGHIKNNTVTSVSILTIDNINDKQGFIENTCGYNLQIKSLLLRSDFSILSKDLALELRNLFTHHQANSSGPQMIPGHSCVWVSLACSSRAVFSCLNENDMNVYRFSNDVVLFFNKTSFRSASNLIFIRLALSLYIFSIVYQIVMWEYTLILSKLTTDVIAISCNFSIKLSIKIMRTLSN